MVHPGRRDDLSKFLVHLTRDYEGKTAADNLLSILRKKKIKARNPHCLFKHELDRLEFTNMLKRQFNTVCLTETPLTQIRRLISKTPGRQIQLKGYGVVFYKAALLEKGASPAIYVNAKGTSLRDYLLNRFRCDFDDINSLKEFKKEQEEFYLPIIQYYSALSG